MRLNSLRINSDFPLPFINRVIKDFNNQQKIAQQNNKEELTIPSYFFEVQATFLLLKLPYCEKTKLNQKTSLENSVNLLSYSFERQKIVPSM